MRGVRAGGLATLLILAAFSASASANESTDFNFYLMGESDDGTLTPFQEDLESDSADSESTLVTPWSFSEINVGTWEIVWGTDNQYESSTWEFSIPYEVEDAAGVIWNSTVEVRIGGSFYDGYGELNSFHSGSGSLQVSVDVDSGQVNDGDMVQISLTVRNLLYSQPGDDAGVRFLWGSEAHDAHISVHFPLDSDWKIVITDGELNTSGPIWIGVSCLKVGCLGMELVVWVDGVAERHEDPHLVEWSGWIEGNVSWHVQAYWGVDSGDLGTEIIVSWLDEWTEQQDLPNIVPPPGSQGEYPQINTSSPCRLHYCGVMDMLSEGVLYVGSLENQSDKDAVMIVGDPGDVLLLNSHRGPNATTIEIWHRSDESKSLVGSIEAAHTPYYFEYPAQGELWIRVVHSIESGYSPYEFEIIRYDDDIEAPGGGELSNPWSHGEPMPFQGDSSLIYQGHLAASDSLGDSLLIESGPKMQLEPFCTSTSAVNVSITLHQIDGTSYSVESGCENVFETSEQTISVEFGFTTQATNAGWTIMLKSLKPGDGNLIGDAPDMIWDQGSIDSRWQVLNLEASVITGTLDVSDTTDFYAFSVTEENGSYVRAQRIGNSPGLFTLMTLDQETGEVVNFTDGSMMIVPPGVHALRVDWEQGMGQGENDPGEYQFSLPYNGPYVPEEVEFVDLSHKARGFYMLAGLLLLTPLAMVIWWNRDAIFRGAPLAADIQEHERRRLRNLRQRVSQALISRDVDQAEIEYSLRQLGDSPWSAVVDDWGEPIIMHLTERVEICVWRVAESTSSLLIGIRVESVPWELAAIRVHAPEGSGVEISSVSPNRMYQDDEVFLDTLPAGSKTFVGIELEGSPTTIGFHLSGLVGGNPLAAVPNKALDWGTGDD